MLLRFLLGARGYTATRHQRQGGTGDCDQGAQVVSSGGAATLALIGSTEHDQL